MAATRRRFLKTMGTAAAGAGTLVQRPVSACSHPATPSADNQTINQEAQGLLEQHVQQNLYVESNTNGLVQSDPRMPSQAEVESWYRDLRNWGRWGTADDKGAINLITPAKSAAAAGLAGHFFCG